MSLLSDSFFHPLFFIIKLNPSRILKGWGSKIFFINRKFALVQYNPSVLILILLNRVFGVCV
ncbi:hypothetical protein [Helicobacter pylori]|uniref:hypothetical protein n=1 Tax=Helicobacter pylori TaxID=210 RepID=UPI00112A6AD7|nr:hypothetical protein [Helicobacter pylori]TPH74815.1 hypothetical protein FIM53_07785 [Helicobacter pylori]WJI96459.1 hypothetical protein QAP00_05075 [Helicobacter pylori]